MNTNTNTKTKTQAPFGASTAQRLNQLKQNIETNYPFFIGFPGSVDFDYRELYPFF